MPRQRAKCPASNLDTALGDSNANVNYSLVASVIDGLLTAEIHWFGRSAIWEESKEALWINGIR